MTHAQRGQGTSRGASYFGACIEIKMQQVTHACLYCRGRKHCLKSRRCSPLDRFFLSHTRTRTHTPSPFPSVSPRLVRLVQRTYTSNFRLFAIGLQTYDGPGGVWSAPRGGDRHRCEAFLGEISWNIYLVILGRT